MLHWLAMVTGSSLDPKESDHHRRIRTYHQQRISKQLTIHNLRCCLSVRNSRHRHEDSNLIHKQVPLKINSKSISKEKSIRTVWRQEMQLLTRTSSNLTCLTQPHQHLYHIFQRQQLLKMKKERVEGRIRIWLTRRELHRLLIFVLSAKQPPSMLKTFQVISLGYRTARTSKWWRRIVLVVTQQTTNSRTNSWIKSRETTRNLSN